VRAAATIALRGLGARPRSTLTRVLVLANGVGLLGAMLLFVGHSLRTMTGSAIRRRATDWQGPLASYGQARAVAAGVARQPGVIQSSAAATGRSPAPATRPGRHLERGGRARCSPYAATTAQQHVSPSSRGRALRARLAVVLDQQLAADAPGADRAIPSGFTPRPGRAPQTFPRIRR